MRKGTKPVLDEREMQVMYRIEHRGLWLMFFLLCAAIIVQLLMGAGIVQMAGELCVLFTACVMLMVSYARHGIWEESARPSAKDNIRTALFSGIAVGVLLLAMKKSVLFSAVAAVAMTVLCYALLHVLMAYMRRRQKREDEALED